MILTIRDNEENWFNSWYKFNEKMNTDVNRVNGGLFASYGTFFMSLGLSGEKWKWHLEVGKILAIFSNLTKTHLILNAEV